MKKLLLPIALIILSCSAEDSCEPTPKLTTAEAEDITDVSATISGTITPPTCDDTVTSQGFVYGEENLPTVDDTKIVKSGSTISASLTNLNQNSTYYIRTFFENPTGVFYGNEVMFSTNVGDALVQTNTVFNITATNALISGRVSSNGGGTITSKGFCFSTEANPTVNDQKVDGIDEGNQFKGILENLTPNTLYYIKAYAENESGVFYGEEKNFKTDDGKISISTNQPHNFKPTSVNLGGQISDYGGSEPTEIGVVWSKNPNPDLSSNVIIWTGDDLMQNLNFEVVATQIGTYSNEEVYYYKSYAKNQFGVFYGQEIEFKIFYDVTDIDGRSYDNKYMCNGRIWLTEGFGGKHYLNGDEITYASDRTAWKQAGEDKIGAWCYTDFDPNKGILYNYYAVEDSRGLIPEGWRLPYLSDFMSLQNCDDNLIDPDGFNIADNPRYTNWRGNSPPQEYNENNPHPRFWIKPQGYSGSGSNTQSVHYYPVNNVGFSLNSTTDKESGYIVRLIKD